MWTLSKNILPFSALGYNSIIPHRQTLIFRNYHLINFFFFNNKKKGATRKKKKWSDIHEMKTYGAIWWELQRFFYTKSCLNSHQIAPCISLFQFISFIVSVSFIIAGGTETMKHTEVFGSPNEGSCVCMCVAGVVFGKLKY